MDYISNVVLGIVVCLVNFLLLLYTEEVIDLVLNSTAVFFALELDECLVDLSESEIKSLYRDFIMIDLNEKLQKIDQRYWDPRKNCVGQIRIRLMWVRARLSAACCLGAVVQYVSPVRFVLSTEFLRRNWKSFKIHSPTCSLVFDSDDK